MCLSALTATGVYFERFAHSTVDEMEQNAENEVYPGLNTFVATLFLKKKKKKII